MKDFEILFAEGGFCGAAICTVRVWKIDPQKYPRRKYSIRDLKIGFLVSKKVSKRAVDRNRLKRQMREVVRLLLLENKIKPGYLIAFSAKPHALGADYIHIEKDIISLLQRTHCLI